MDYNVSEFYPTPDSLLDKIMEGFKWINLTTVLEPSAGKGNIADYMQNQYNKKSYGGKLDIDCIEIDENLRFLLKGKGLRVVHDDFLTYSTFKKYDLIIMNPPFSKGSAHLLKALDMQKDGGYVICILNAETIKNPYTNERKTLVKKLEYLNADISYMQEEFVAAERSTKVEIAVVKAYIPEKEQKSFIYEDLKKKSYSETQNFEATDLTINDFIKSLVQMYELEVECGIKLIHEYMAMSPHILQDLRVDSSYNNPILTMKLYNSHNVSINAFVKEVRRKYWNVLFRDRRFTCNMTSNFQSEYLQKINELIDYDFSVYNIKCMQVEISRNLIQGIEDCIVKLFDELSFQYSYSDELKQNIHYYNGWKTNKSWYINKKVVLPCINAFDSYDKSFCSDSYKITSKLMDIEKALNYLDGGLTDCLNMTEALKLAKKTGQTRKIRLKYFYVTFYKKGTCHIEFIDEKLLKKLNIFGSQHKKWLPQGYGKKTYQEMNPEEQAVIDDFEGKDNYDKVLKNAKYFIYNPKNSMPLLEDQTIS